MYVERHTVTLVTDAAGAATGYTPAVMGRVLGIVYTKIDYAAGVDFDVATETTGQTVWDQDDVNASAVVYPRAALQSVAGVALTYDATQPVTEAVAVANDRVKIVVANGGDTKSGTFTVIVG